LFDLKLFQIKIEIIEVYAGLHFGSIFE